MKLISIKGVRHLPRLGGKDGSLWIVQKNND